MAGVGSDGVGAFAQDGLAFVVGQARPHQSIGEILRRIDQHQPLHPLRPRQRQQQVEGETGDLQVDACPQHTPRAQVDLQIGELSAAARNLFERNMRERIDP